MEDYFEKYFGDVYEYDEFSREKIIKKLKFLSREATRWMDVDNKRRSLRVLFMHN